MTSSFGPPSPTSSPASPTSYTGAASPPGAPMQPTGRLARWADALRARFDRATARRPPISVLAALGAAAGVGAALIKVALGPACADLPVSLMRLEVTYTGPHFAALFGAEGGCRPRVIASFLPDMLFPVAYALFLSALFAWAERWRRFEYRTGVPLPAVRDWRRDLGIVAPLAAGALDIVVENVPLLLASVALYNWGARPSSPLVNALALVGSVGATLKWLLVFVSFWELARELLRGPRGLVLRRLRFSALAVAVGALPLLVVAQGQDILQRLVEGEHPYVRIVFAVLAISFGSTAVWYCGRRLVQFRFERDEADPDRHAARASSWYDFFAVNLPRLLGVSALVVCGAAFAVAGLAKWRFLALGAAGVVVVLTVERRAPGLLERLGAMLVRALPALPGWWRDVPQLPTRIAETAIAAALGALLVWPHWFPWEVHGRFDDGERSLRALRVAAWLCLVATWVFYLFVYFRRARAAARAEPLPDPYDAHATVTPGLRRAVVAAAALSLTALVAIAAAPVAVGRLLGPVWVLALAIANAVFFGSIAVWLHARYGVPVVRIGVALAVLFGLWNENHRVRTLAPPAGAARLTLTAHLDEWVAARTAERSAAAAPAAADSALPVVLVAAAGGGLRAAYWTALALAAVQDTNPAFARQLFAISGVSGGSVGAAVFAALARDAAPRVDGLPCAVDSARRVVHAPYSACVRRFMGDDFLSPVLAKMAAPDLAQRFLPVPVAAFDRSTGLEGSWERSYEDATRRRTLREGLLSLAADSTARRGTPALLLNSTHVESGRRYVASPFVTDSAGGFLQDGRDVLRLLRADVPLSTAAHNSARFTYVSPAGHLERPSGEELGRVVDGGYFENSGLVTLREVVGLVRAHSARHVAGEPPLRPIVLYLCNHPVNCRLDRTGDTTRRVASTSLNEALAPLRALLDTRDARGSLAEAQLREEMGRDFLELDVCDRLTVPQAGAAPADTARLVRTRDRVVSPPLGWLLSKLARDWMDSSLAAAPGPRLSECRANNARVLATLDAVLARGAQR